MPKKSIVEKDDFENEVVIKEPGEKLDLWKPEKVGESVEGKLMAISQTKFNRILRLVNDEGTISVPVSTFLEDIDFERYLDQKIRFEFAGVSGKRDCKLFKVTVAQDKF